MSRVKKIIAGIILFVIAACAVYFQHGAVNYRPKFSLHHKHILANVYEAAKRDEKFEATVTNVVDGDTIDIENESGSERVRLLGINTPETVDPRKPVQCFGKEASEETKGLLLGKRVEIETDSSQDLYDAYGRLLAYVYLPDGTNINKLLIAEGYAHEYTFHFSYKYQTDFKIAEQQARQLQKGVWAEGVCE